MNRRRWMRTRRRLANPVPWLLVSHPDRTPGMETVDRIRDAIRREEPRGVVLPAGTRVEFHGRFARGGRLLPGEQFAAGGIVASPPGPELVTLPKGAAVVPHRPDDAVPGAKRH